MPRWFVRSLKEAAWGPILVLVVWAIALNFVPFYRAHPRFDMVTHFLGGFAMTYFYMVSARNVEEVVGRIPRAIRALLCIGLTAITAVAWEFGEYLSDQVLATHMNHGVSDTLSDLFFGITGAVVFVVLAIVRK